MKVIRAKRVEVPHGDYTFPLADEEPSKPPRLDDQDCFADGAGPDDDDNDDGPPNDDAPALTTAATPKGISLAHPRVRRTRTIKLLKGPSPEKGSPLTG